MSTVKICKKGIGEEENPGTNFDDGSSLEDGPRFSTLSAASSISDRSIASLEDRKDPPPLLQHKENHQEQDRLSLLAYAACSVKKTVIFSLPKSKHNEQCSKKFAMVRSFVHKLKTVHKVEEKLVIDFVLCTHGYIQGQIPEPRLIANVYQLFKSRPELAHDFASFILIKNNATNTPILITSNKKRIASFAGLPSRPESSANIQKIHHKNPSCLPPFPPPCLPPFPMNSNQLSNTPRSQQRLPLRSLLPPLPPHHASSFPPPAGEEFRGRLSRLPPPPAFIPRSPQITPPAAPIKSHFSCY